MGGDRGLSLDTTARHLRAVGRVTLDFLLPAACPCCDTALVDGEEEVVCGHCWARVVELPSPQCARCGYPGTGQCRWCALLPGHVFAVRSFCWTHRGSGSAIIHALKYGRWSAVATGVARRMARLAWPMNVAADCAALVPVPLAESRLRERGFNQSERLAHALGPRWRLPVWTGVLARARETETQTRLTPTERQANVSGAFRVRDTARQRIAHTHLVLADDVVTTAATLNACAAALVAAGARAVSYVTFGRAPAAGDR